MIPVCRKHGGELTWLILLKSCRSETRGEALSTTSARRAHAASAEPTIGFDLVPPRGDMPALSVLTTPYGMLQSVQ